MYFKKLNKLNLSIYTVFILLTVTFENSIAQEVECNAPPGFICGSAKGTKFDLEWIYVHGIPMPLPKITATPCCLPSVQSNACNAVSVGCSTVTPK